MSEHCPACGTPLLHAGGIGDFCPNKECDVSDGPAVWPNLPRFVPPPSPAAALAAKDAEIASLRSLVRDLEKVLPADLRTYRGLRDRISAALKETTDG